MAKIIALYLPQYHPIKENDEWYGKGFTEWRSVASAKKLYKGHYQPHIPADLGFYDLRLHETIVEQADLAKKHGVDGFCYWHYWFGNGKELLENPFKTLLRDKSIGIEFCLAWANHSWEKKQWSNNGKNVRLITQEYPGMSDYERHFYAYLEAFKDCRYIRVDNKPLFLIYEPLDSPEIPVFIECWRKLASKEGLDGIYFVGHDINGKNRDIILKLGFDGVYDDRMLDINNHQSYFMKIARKVRREIFHRPTVFKYKKAIEYMITEDIRQKEIFPTIVPNWDHSPRSGGSGIIFDECEPKYFELLLRKTYELISDKPKEYQIIIVKSWNEWGEGNHLEPDMKYGKGYLEAIQRVKIENDY